MVVGVLRCRPHPERMQLITADDMGGMTVARSVAHGQPGVFGFSECLLDLLRRVRPPLHNETVRKLVDNVNHVVRVPLESKHPARLAPNRSAYRTPAEAMLVASRPVTQRHMGDAAERHCCRWTQGCQRTLLGRLALVNATRWTMERTTGIESASSAWKFVRVDSACDVVTCRNVL